jgi:hypothetical protein
VEEGVSLSARLPFREKSYLDAAARDTGAARQSPRL